MLSLVENKSVFVPIEEWADAILLNAEPKVIALLTAYFDASYDQPDKKLLVVAGCVAEVSQWKKFEVEWKDLLDSEGLEFFHMTDFEAYQGAFKHWTSPQRIAFMKKAAAIIRERAGLIVARSVLEQDFRWAASQNLNLAAYNPFTFCSIQCLQGIAKWADSCNHDGPIAYVFEKGDRQDQHLYELMDYIEGSEERTRLFRWQGLTILPKVPKTNKDPAPHFQVLAFQAADIWAFEVRKEMENYHIPGKPLRDFRKSLSSLRQGVGDESVGYFTREGLLEITVEDF